MRDTAVQEGAGGVLFIDEAYQLADGSPLDKEALSRAQEMLQQNPGLSSRFNDIKFEPYSAEEQRQILQKLAEKSEITISSDAALEEMLAELQKPVHQEAGIRSIVAVAEKVEARRTAAAACVKAARMDRQQQLRNAARTRPKLRL